MGQLTALKIRSLIKTGRYSDGDGPFLEIKGGGAANWVLRVRNRGNCQDIGSGSQKAVSLKDTREAFFLTGQKIAQGIDPVAERKQERPVISRPAWLRRWSTNCPLSVGMNEWRKLDCPLATWNVRVEPATLSTIGEPAPRLLRLVTLGQSTA